MAASITGVFTIIDRASGPMRKMEAQAKKTMGAIHAVGDAQDRAAGGSAARRLEQQERGLRNVERAARGAARETDTHARATRGADRDTRGLIDRLIRLGGVLATLRLVMRATMFAGMGVAVTSLAQAVGVLGGGLVALVPRVLDTVGALAALPAALGAAVQGIGTLMLALGGVGGAVSAGIKQQTQAGRTAEDMAEKHRNAANSIRSAERQLFLAQRTGRDAQRELTRARQEARRELVDLRLAAQGAALGEARAALSLREARQNLARGATDPGTGELEMAGLQLGVREAQLGMRQARVERARARADAQRGIRQGVEGSDRVRQARRGLQDAIYGQTEATRALAEAQHDANRQMTEGNAAANAFEDAMKDLSPEARALVHQLIGMKPALLELRAAAGRELFPSLGRALSQSTRLLPMLRGNLQRTGGIIGRHAEGFAGDMTTGARMGDLNALMRHQAGLVDRGGRSIRNLIDALLDLALAARPFTNWLADTVEGWTRFWKESSAAGRATGRTAAFLDRTRSALELFGRILRNVWITLRELFEAARPLGDRLWAGAEKATEGWANYLQTVEGSRRAEAWFNKLYEPLHEMGQLSKDLLVIWAKITVNGNFTRSIQILRTATPDLERLLTNLSGLGPASAEFLAELVRLLANLPFEPLTLFVRALTLLLKTINLLMETIPGLGHVLSGLIAAGLVAKVLGYLGKVRLLRGAWMGVRSAIMGTVVAQGLLTTGGLVGGGPGGRGGRGGGRAGGPGLLTRALQVSGLAAAGGWLATGRTGALLRRVPGVGAAAGAIQGRRAAARLGPAGEFGFGAVLGEQARAERGAGRRAALRGAGRVAGKVAFPAAIATELAFAAESTGHSSDVLNKNFNRIAADAQRLAKAGDVRGIEKLKQDLKMLGYEADTKAAPAFDKMRTALDKARGSAVRMRDTKIAEEMGNKLRNMTTLTRGGVSDILRDLGRLSPGSRRRVALQMIAMEKEMERMGIRPKGSTTRLRQALLGRLDGLAAGAKRRTERMIRSIARALEAGLDTLLPGVSAIARLIGGATDPKKTGVSRLDLLKNLGKPTVAMDPKQLAGFQRQYNLPEGPAGVGPARALGHRLGFNIKIVEETNEKVRRSHRRTRRDVDRTARGSHEDIRRASRSTQRDVSKANDAIADNSRRKMRSAREGMRDHARGARREVGAAFEGINRDALKALVGMGYSRPDAARLIAGKSSVAPTGMAGDPVKGPPAPKARGGRITGTGLRDTVPVAPGHIAAPGELIVNRHTERRVNAKLGGRTTLGREVAGEATPHSAALRPMGHLAGLPSTPGHMERMPNSHMAHALGGLVVFAYGGRMAGGVGGNWASSQKLVESFIPMAKRAGISTFGGKRSTRNTTSGGMSDHFIGNLPAYAIDFMTPSGGPDAAGDKFAAGAAEALGFGSPVGAQTTTKGGYRVQMIWRSMTGGNHFNHIHIGARRVGRGGAVWTAGPGGVGVGGEGIKPLKAPRSRYRGAPGALSNRAAAVVAQAMTDEINRNLGAGGDLTVGGATGSARANMLVGKQMAARMGWVGPQWRALRTLWMKESGWINQMNKAGSGATGIPQALPGSKMASEGADWRTNEKTQMAWGLKYIKGRYGSPSRALAFHLANNWYGQGGRIPEWGGWHARGGRFSVSRPTLFGAGEGGGAEDVTITPKAHRGGAGRGNVNVTIEHIDYRREGDVAEAIKAELAKVEEDLDLVGAEED